MTVGQLLGVLQACDLTDEVIVRIVGGPDAGSVRGVDTLQPHWTQIVLNTTSEPLDGDGPQISMGTAAAVLQREVAAREQAERERSSLAATLQMVDDKIRATVGTESRLEKVPALVDDLRLIAGGNWDDDSDLAREIRDFASAALTAWEQE